MVPPLACKLSFEIFAAFAVVGTLELAILHHSAWRTHRSLRLAWLGALLALGAAHAAWEMAGPRHYPVSALGADVACVGLILVVPFVCALPLAALVRVVFSRLLLRAPPSPSRAAHLSPVAVAAGPAIGRRVFVQASTVSVPLAAMGVASLGFVEAASIEEPVVRMPFESLPPALEGLTILHLSDLHLGVGRTLADLDRVLGHAMTSRTKPDLIVLTGDIAEDVRLLPDALRLVASSRARLGAFASLGNHEYLRGIEHARRAYDRGPVPLLVDSGTHIDVGGASLFVTAVDDPVWVHTDNRPWLRERVDRALRGRRAGDTTLLLSHRPESFDAAAGRGVDLVLSGHTHGGQIGFDGRSAFEPLYPDGYLWGAYRRGASRLYTSAGMGHWFPFRFRCPAEAPRIVLTARAASEPLRTTRAAPTRPSRTRSG